MAMNHRLLRPRASGFDPRRVAGLALWINAQDAVLSGSNVSSWPDRSGRGFTAAVFSGTPTYAATDMNGRPAVKFDGSTTMRVDANVYSFGLTDSLTMFAMIKAPAPGTALATRRFIHCGGETLNALYFGMQVRPFNGAQNYGGLLSKAGVSNAQATSSTAVTDVRKLCSFSYDGSTARFYLNGVQAATVSSVPTTLSGSVTNAGRFCIGGDVFNNTASWQSVCDLSEAIVYSRLLSDEERNSVTDYLTNLYAPQ